MGRGRGEGWNWEEDEEERGGAFGDRGQGEGGEAPETPGDAGTEKSKVKGQLGKGTYVGAYTMKGEPPRGEAAVQYAEVQQAYAEHALDALQKQKVPASYREFVRQYFDAIRLEKAGGAERK